MTPQPPRIPRSCFAPPVDAEKLASYRNTIDAECARLDPVFGAKVREAAFELLDCVSQWLQLPPSSRTDGERWTLRAGGKSVVVQETPLDNKKIADLWSAVPWDYECDAIRDLFDSIPTDRKELRDAVFHLLWFAYELTYDREPITQDKWKELAG